MKPCKSDAGKRCVVAYDDIGHVDALLLEPANIENHWRVFVFADHTANTVSVDIIIEIGEIIRPRKVNNRQEPARG